MGKVAGVMNGGLADSKTTGLKKVILVLICLFAFSAAQSQGADTTRFPSREQLLNKSWAQKSVGWFMVGTGIPVALACLYFLTFPDDALSEKGLVGAVLAGSTVYTIIGINLLKKGARNKARAASLSLGRQSVPFPSFPGNNFHWQPALSCRIRL